MHWLILSLDILWGELHTKSKVALTLKNFSISFILILFLAHLFTLSVKAEILEWNTQNPLPYPIASQSTIYNDNRIFLFGGATSDDTDKVISSDISTSGNLVSWSDLLQFPNTIYFHSTVSKNDKIYSLGGNVFPPGSAVRMGFTGYLNSSNSIIGWTQNIDLPEPRMLGGATIVGDYIYYLGGIGSSSVYFARINSDGSLNSWNTTTPLPTTSQWGIGVVSTDSSIVIIGGNGVTGYTNKTFQSFVNSDGTLGSWIERSTLPKAFNRSGVTRIGNTIISAGGDNVDTGGPLNDVYYASVDATGTIGSWSTSSNPLPRPICCGSLTNNGKYLYYTGGAAPAGEYLDSVYVSSIASSTPVPTPKILLVPGSGASWNADALLNCKNTNITGDWTLASYAQKYYQPLIDTLEQNGLTVVPYFYDWRKNIGSHNSDLEAFVNSHLASGEKFDVISHSMGGLLSANYLTQSTSNNNRFNKLLLAGVPLKGAVHAYPAWEAGEIWNENRFMKMAMTIALKRCGWPTHTDRELIRTHFPSTQDLLPIFTYLIPKNPFTLYSQPHNSFLTGLSLNNTKGTELGLLTGFDHRTLSELIVETQSLKDAINSVWDNGNPIKKIYSSNGDGTVLFDSSRLNNITPMTINTTHSFLLSAVSGQQHVLNFLNVAEPTISSINNEYETNTTLIMSDAADFSILLLDKHMNSSNGLLSFEDYKPGKYKLNIQPKKTSGQIIVAQFTADNEVLWDEYDLSDFSNTLTITLK
jgi:pimeloyl-ACP methyl ester carboxylesterase